MSEFPRSKAQHRGKDWENHLRISIGLSPIEVITESVRKIRVTGKPSEQITRFIATGKH